MKEYVMKVFNIHPLPSHFGIGFTSDMPNQEWIDLGYNYNPINNYHNYHVTPQAWKWPIAAKAGTALIDGFSPNLNKLLHAGHLKNLAVATALSNIACDGKSVAMLGASLGVIPGAIEAYKEWCDLAGYNPKIYLDTELPPPNTPLEDGTGEYAGCKLFNGVVIYKSNGKPTYSAHDLSFAEHVSPTHYLTGAEQKEHFKSLGLGDKHLPLGLVLGADGKKMKSSIKKEGDEANALSALELLNEVISILDETPEPKKLAWNILAWQFNSSQVSQNTKCNLKQWAKSESPGLYITYTFAKMKKALSVAGNGDPSHINQQHANVLGIAGQFSYYFQKSQQYMQPCHVAQYAMVLAKALSTLYNNEKFIGGNPGLIYSANVATDTLGDTMKALGMHPLLSV